MFRGSIALAALSVSHGQFAVNLAALEDFSSDYNLVIAVATEDTTITTQPFPPSAPSEHGSVAVDARNLQLKLDNRMVIPEGFNPPVPDQELQMLLQQLAGHEIQEELHINGVHGQASFHLASPILNACIQVDVPPQPIPHEMMEARLGQAQGLAQNVFDHEGHPGTVDGTPGHGILLDHGQTIFAIDDDSHPLLVVPDRNGQYFPALKFSNYVNSVGDQFAVRACEVEAQSATQTMLAENPEVRNYVAGRIAAHQSRLQALLEPKLLNTRFSFVPLEVMELMMAPAPKPCGNDVLAETTPMGLSSFQTVVFSVCSFVMGIAATFGTLRKKAVSSPSDYHEVCA
jgi:hypothetical protein